MSCLRSSLEKSFNRSLSVAAQLGLCLAAAEPLPSRDREGVPMSLRPTKGDESRGPGVPGPYRNAALSVFTPSDPVSPVGATHAWPVAVRGGA